MTFEKIAEIIAENRGIDVSEIKMETSFEELGLTPLTLLSLQ